MKKIKGQEGLGKIAGIDFGEVRLGLSLSDERHVLASPLPVMKALSKLEDTAAAVLKMLGTVDLIVIGFPLMLNGTEGLMAKKVRLFSEALKTLFSGEIIFWDERLTSSQAEKILKEARVNRKQRMRFIDSLSAVLILQNYLDFKSHQS